MHPREFKRQRTGTGRVTRVSLTNSEIMVGVNFTDHEQLNRALADPRCYPVLLFPGMNALNMSSSAFGAKTFPRQPLVVILDATWASARKMLNESTNLQKLPRISFDYSGDSLFVIKRQPGAFALSTIEATFQVLDLLNSRGYEKLAGQHQALLGTLHSIVRFQLSCENNPNLVSHRVNTKRSRDALLSGVAHGKTQQSTNTPG